ncbi:MAG TPA: 50S ribosomal protein L24 [Veillonellaceae bacterium]|jgi:large subunit ribosomal protein L24|nr:50S ribosomal protein L24 [Veillonellaceae bacterium]
MSHKLHVKHGDTVVVISGKDKGKQGKVTEAQPKKDRVIVEGINLVKRHTKPTQANPKGGIITKEAAIHVSKVMILDPETKKPSRIKKVQQKDGSYVRAAVKSGALLDESK